MGGALHILVPTVWIVVAACAFGGLSLALGMDANWDLRNYHYYLPYAFLGQREDILAAQAPTFFNPLLDIPFFLAAEAWPARWVGGALGALHAAPFALLLLLARRTLTLEDPVDRTHAAGVIALVGVTGAGALSEVGTVFYDALLPVGFLSSLLLIVSHGPFMVEGGARGLLLAFVAGVPAWIAAALKLPHAAAAVGVCAAALALPGPPMRRALVVIALAAGVAVGMGLAGGWWHGHLWHVYGNPVFPAFNDVFRSPWAGFESYRGNDFLPAGWGERLGFALVYPLAPEKTSEVPFRDFRIATLFALALLAVAARLAGRWTGWTGREEKHGRLVHALSARCILAAATGFYLAWVAVFAIYRYAIGLEMLAPLALVALIDRVPGRRVWAWVVLGAMVATTIPADWGRAPWGARYRDVQGLPALPEDSMVLMVGRGALSFLIPSFPREVRFVRIESWFTKPEDDHGFVRLMRGTVATHRGPLFMLFVEDHDRTRAHPMAAAYGLRLEACSRLTASISVESYSLCALSRERLSIF